MGQPSEFQAPETAGHGAVTFPRPRNTVDAATPFGAACSNPGAQRGNATAPGNGQACVSRASLRRYIRSFARIRGFI
jgi:hypothetical protein